MNSSETYTLQYVKQITSVILVYEAGHQKPVLSDNLEGWAEVGGGKEVPEGGDI